ncbi:MAG TPA: PilZ domain-containing protein [Methylomirabilota bacterium]|nr:PilZ domain-containing protein [Methylomirabilota bacterium]
MGKKPDEIRNVRRLKTNMAAWVTGPSTPGFAAQVADISINGCRLVWREAKRISGVLSVEIPDARLSAQCEVAWQRSHSAGLRFLSRTVLEPGPDPEPDPEARITPTSRPAIVAKT